MLAEYVSNSIGWVKSEVNSLRHLKQKSREQAKKQMWYDYITRQIPPDVFNILSNKLILDEYEVECFVVGQHQGKTDGLPPENVFNFQKKIMATTIEDCVISVCQAIEPVPTDQAQDQVDDAIYYNLENRKNYMDSNELHADNEYAKLDHRDLVQTVEVLHDNKENMFMGAYIITIWAVDQKAMNAAKSKLKGVLREYKILGRLPLKRMYEAFMTGQPYPDMWEGAIIKMFTKMSAVLSPTLNPINNLSGSGTGIFIGFDKVTGKAVSVDFWDREAPHVLVVGSTGSGKTYFLSLVLLRLYLEGRKVIYLTTKDDERTNFEAPADYLDDGGIIDIGNQPGCHNINPLQIIRVKDDLTKDEAKDVYDNQKDIVNAFVKTSLEDQYSFSSNVLLDEMIDKLYKKSEFGIVRDNPKTWVNWPFMKDLVKVLEEELPHLKWRRKDTCQTLLDKLYHFRENGRWGYVNRPTDIDFSLNYSVIKLTKVPEGLREPMNVLLTSIIASQVSAAGTKGLTVVIDEGEDFLKDPKLAEIPLKGAAKWRAQNTQLIFTLHELDDMDTKKMSSILMSNTFYKFIFGSNMDDSLIPFVQDYLKMPQNQLDNLKKCNQGDCILKIRDNYNLFHVTPDDKAKALLASAKKAKGLPVEEQTLEEIQEEVEAGFTIKEQYKQIVDEKTPIYEHIIFEHMLEGSYNAQALIEAGYKKEYPQRALDSGTIVAWVHESLRNGDHVLQQTLDHYATVIQIMLYLIEKGFTEVFVHHRHGVDIEAKYSGETYAFEFERDGTRSVEAISDKFLRAREQFDHVYFISVTTNKNKVIKAVEDPERIKQKLAPVNMRPRGGEVKELIDEITRLKEYNDLNITQEKPYKNSKT
jgi:hypothetical protein